MLLNWYHKVWSKIYFWNWKKKISAEKTQTPPKKATKKKQVKNYLSDSIFFS